MKLTKHLALPLCALALFASRPLVTAAASSWQVVASGLDNPRGLEFGPDGALYIAQAGRGGDGPCGPGPEGTRCFGHSGAISRLDVKSGTVTDVVTGLPSLATEAGQMFAIGPNDLSLQGKGNLFFTIGFGGDPATKGTFGDETGPLAHIGRANPSGNWKLEEDLGAFEAANNPAGDEVDTNPYGILALAGKQIVADAGANALLEVKQNGRIRPLATFPNRDVPAGPFGPPGSTISMDAVPTSVAVGPNGDYFVGQLTGFPFPVGEAKVWRVPAGGGTPQVYASGFTHIVDLTFGPDGTLYVLEIVKNGLVGPLIFQNNDWTGALYAVKPGQAKVELVPGTLTAPGGVAVGKDGALYVTNNSIFSGIGEVIKIQP